MYEDSKGSVQMFSPHVNPLVLHDLHAMRQRATPAIVTFRSEGASLASYMEVCDLDARMVALWSFDAGMILHIAVGSVTNVELAPESGYAA
jgi:hypothetical protein